MENFVFLNIDKRGVPINSGWSEKYRTINKREDVYQAAESNRIHRRSLIENFFLHSQISLCFLGRFT